MSASIDDVLDYLVRVDGVKEAKWSSEDTTQGKPAILVMVPSDGLSESEMEDIGARAREFLRHVLDWDEVKASIEHPIRYDEEADGIVTVDEECVIKVRWMKKTRGRLSDTRLNGRPITKDVEVSQSVGELTD
jgi:hypothetical protein